MDGLSENRLLLSGVIASDLEESHGCYGETFFSFLLSVPRKSGVSDLLPVTAAERVVGRFCRPGVSVTLTGQVRAYSRYDGGASHLHITAYAQRLYPAEDAALPQNEAALTGYLCKPPFYRKTPLSREITDLLIAVNRPYGKTDYLPVIVWGRNAVQACDFLTGDCVHIEGRFQSRGYQKRFPDGTIAQKTAYEISASLIARL